MHCVPPEIRSDIEMLETPEHLHVQREYVGSVENQSNQSLIIDAGNDWMVCIESLVGHN